MYLTINSKTNNSAIKLAIESIDVQIDSPTSTIVHQSELTQKQLEKFDEYVQSVQQDGKVFFIKTGCSFMVAR